MDLFEKDEIIQLECPKKNTWEYASYKSTS